MSDENRENYLQSLFEKGEYTYQDNDDETVINMVERYQDIENEFPTDLIHDDIMLFFIDWLIENVVMVEIVSYSDESAYTIFETMNNRGLSLTPTEMLKGYVLSKITNKKQQVEINDIWKKEIQKIHTLDKNLDQRFFQAWFRAQYACSSTFNTDNKDFETIGSRFHHWFKDKHESYFNLQHSDDFYQFFKNQFPFFVKWYIEIYNSMKSYNVDIPHLYYINNWGIAESIQEPLLLSPIKYSDTEEIIKLKIDFIARYIETFTVKKVLIIHHFVKQPSATLCLILLQKSVIMIYKY